MSVITQVSMTLHNDKEVFKRLIRQTADCFRTSPILVEHDYWVALILNRLALSKQVNSVVVTGAFTQSMAHKLCYRLSNNINILTINENLSLDVIEKQSQDIVDDVVADDMRIIKQIILEKDPQFKQIILQYPNVEKYSKPFINQITLDMKPFTNSHQYRRQPLVCLIENFLDKTNDTDTMLKYNILPFSIYVVDKTRIFTEKVVTLSRLSCADNGIDTLCPYVQYIYDIFYLASDPDCLRYMQSKSFKLDYLVSFAITKYIHNEPTGWKSFDAEKTPLIMNFPKLWEVLYPVYEKALANVTYSGHIPDKETVAECFENLIAQILSPTSPDNKEKAKKKKHGSK
jgi:hypothetical protein